MPPTTATHAAAAIQVDCFFAIIRSKFYHAPTVLGECVLDRVRWARMVIPQTDAYRYSLLGWARLLYGPMFLLFGAGFLVAFALELQHAQRNGGLSTGALDLAMWGGFLLVPAVFLACGAAMLQSDRRSWIESGAWHSVRGEVPMFHRARTRIDVRGFYAAKVLLFAVYGKRTTVVGSRYQTFALLANGKKIVIAWFSAEKDAQSLADRFEREVGSTPKLTTVGFDATPWYLSGSQSPEYRMMREDKPAAALYDALCDAWEKAYADLRPSGGPSYSESNEAFPYRGSFEVDLELLRHSHDLQRFDRATRTLSDLGLVSLPKNS